MQYPKFTQDELDRWVNDISGIYKTVLAKFFVNNFPDEQECDLVDILKTNGFPAVVLKHRLVAFSMGIRPSSSMIYVSVLVANTAKELVAVDTVEVETLAAAYESLVIMHNKIRATFGFVAPPLVSMSIN
jgi:hypothetical protein